LRNSDRDVSALRLQYERPAPLTFAGSTAERGERREPFSAWPGATMSVAPGSKQNVVPSGDILAGIRWIASRRALFVRSGATMAAAVRALVAPADR